MQVARTTLYDERLKRARAAKLPKELTPGSPAPRLAVKERPTRLSIGKAFASSKKPKENRPSDNIIKPVDGGSDAPSFKQNPFLLADGLKKNPVAGRAKLREVPPPPVLPVTSSTRSSQQTAPPEPRAISSLSESQRARLQDKRISIMQAKQMKQEVAHESAAEVAEHDMEHMAQDRSEDEQEVGVAINPLAAAPRTKKRATRTKNKKTIEKKSSAAAELRFLRNKDRVSSELVQAVSHMLPEIENQMKSAIVSNAQAESLADILRRQKRARARSRR